MANLPGVRVELTPGETSPSLNSDPNSPSSSSGRSPENTGENYDEELRISAAILARRCLGPRCGDDQPLLLLSVMLLCDLPPIDTAVFHRMFLLRSLHFNAHGEHFSPHLDASRV